MTSTRSGRISVAFALSFALLVLAPLASAAETPKVVGTWDAVAVTPQGSLPVVITVKIVEGQPKCEVEVAATKQAVSEEKLVGNVLTMKVSYESRPVRRPGEGRRRQHGGHLAGRRLLGRAQGHAPAVAASTAHGQPSP